MTLHHESKPLSVYTLSVAKDGSKLKEVDPATASPNPRPEPGIGHRCSARGSRR
ncbi:MAG: DUF3738 domain-containing protein [Mycobacterium sp.]